MKNLLLERGDRTNEVIRKARAIPREEAIKKVDTSKETQRPVFVIKYDPRLPSITGIVRRHWKTMTSRNPKLKETFSLWLHTRCHLT